MSLTTKDPHMSKNPASDLFELSMQTWLLSIEASQVIWLRSLRLMTGGKLAEREAERMVREKLVANLMLWPTLAMGGLGQDSGALARRALEHYARPVRANRKRLSSKR